jgi:hypothetical protein
MTPDVFSYNFLGYTGNFVIHPDGEVVTLPHNNLKITPADDGLNITQFEVLTPDGTYFLFKDAENAQNEIFCGPGEQLTEEFYNSSWYLSKMVSPDQRDSITFSYGYHLEKLFYRSGEMDHRFLEEIVLDSSIPITCNRGIPGKKCFTMSTTGVRDLNTIVSVEDSARFFSSLDRDDVSNGIRLDSIQVWKRHGTKIQTIKFDNNQYFEARGNLYTQIGSFKIDELTINGQPDNNLT